MELDICLVRGFFRIDLKNEGLHENLSLLMDRARKLLWATPLYSSRFKPECHRSAVKDPDAYIQSSIRIRITLPKCGAEYLFGKRLFQNRPEKRRIPRKFVSYDLQILRWPPVIDPREHPGLKTGNYSTWWQCCGSGFIFFGSRLIFFGSGSYFSVSFGSGSYMIFFLYS